MFWLDVHDPWSDRHGSNPDDNDVGSVEDDDDADDVDGDDDDEDDDVDDDDVCEWWMVETAFLLLLDVLLCLCVLFLHVALVCTCLLLV